MSRLGAVKPTVHAGTTAPPAALAPVPAYERPSFLMGVRLALSAGAARTRLRRRAVGGARRRARPERGRSNGGERLGHGHGAAQEGPERGPGQVQAGQRGERWGPGVGPGRRRAWAWRGGGHRPEQRRAHRAPSLFPQAILAAQRRGEDVETSKKCGYPAGERSGLRRLPGMGRGGRRRHRPAEPTIPSWAVRRSPGKPGDDALELPLSFWVPRAELSLVSAEILEELL